MILRGDQRRGTTSACAENTSTSLTTPRRARNYLRVRGEYRNGLSIAFVYQELPPRARRILFLKHLIINRNGTTSACAENTQPCPEYYPRPGNYLRVRGEYVAIRWKENHAMELPPRARRILFAGFRVFLLEGTTSACAENTVGRSIMGFGAGNYLRVRGEYRQDVGQRTPYPELPPRARRIHCCTHLVLSFGGTTSACAENTPTLVDEITFGRNYLRVRGEYAVTTMEGWKKWELPPRARRIPQSKP